MLLEDFDFPLPEELIAQTPAPTRDQSRLMLLAREQDTPPRHTFFPALLDQLTKHDLLIMNNARVIPARIQSHKSTGGKVELLFVSSLSPANAKKKEFSTQSLSGVDLLQPEKSLLHPAHLAQDEAEKEGWGELWAGLAKSSRPLRSGAILTLTGGGKVRVGQRLEGGQIELQLDRSLSTRGLISYLEEHGEMPLPPYISPSPEVDHRDRYQTVYASAPGAIAAPTAGLHFTPDLLNALRNKGVTIAEVTLHVGLGTFLPVRVDHIEDHQMHEESFSIPAETVSLWQQTRRNCGRVVSVGTTALRALESAIDENGQLQAGDACTSIFIRPGYTFRAVDALLTNFHLPKSTLMMLVAAFHGHQRIMAAYQEAVEERYRFFSYGDAMFIG